MRSSSKPFLWESAESCGRPGLGERGLMGEHAGPEHSLGHLLDGLVDDAADLVHVLLRNTLQAHAEIGFPGMATIPV